MQEALKSCMSMLMNILMTVGEPEDEITVRDIYKVIGEIKENSEGLPMRNPEVMDGETSEIALDTIAKHLGDKDFIKKSVADICKHYKINIEQ